MLANVGGALQATPFAVGFRVEHPQALINEIKYGKRGRQDLLPAADYRLTYNEGKNTKEHRGVYSFCMCPGGIVVPTPTELDALCINGMSYAARQGRFANSALVVTILPEDLAAFASQGPFAGSAFLRDCEVKAFVHGGGQFTAPATRLMDFMAHKASTTLAATTYRRGLKEDTLHELYPPAVIQVLIRALTFFDKKYRGFLTEEANLIGVETRTASPIRVLRDDTLQAVGIRGIYPAGEGMGYGGGIVSAAVDGIRAAEALLTQVGAKVLTKE